MPRLPGYGQPVCGHQSALSVPEQAVARRRMSRLGITKHAAAGERGEPVLPQPGQLPDQRVLPTSALYSRTRWGARASITEVLVRPAWASPSHRGAQARTSPSSPRSRRYGPGDGLRVAAMCGDPEDLA